MDLNETKQLLRAYGISPKKIQGQNFLVDDALATREVEAAKLKPSHNVLEIGPGLGALTEKLLEIGCDVIAVEKDPSFVKVLKDRFPNAGKLELIEGDILKTDFPDFDVVVSNIPYKISSPLTFKLLRHSFSHGIMMYQEEFAYRLVASPGGFDYSRLSVMSQYYAKTEILESVPQSAFYPQPKVRSAVVKFRPHPPPFKVNEDRFHRLVRGMFTVKKRTLRNGLRIAGKMEKLEVDISQISDELLERRVFELSLEEIATISNMS